MATYATNEIELKQAILGGGHNVSVLQLAKEDRKALDDILNDKLVNEIVKLSERLDPKVRGELKGAAISYETHSDKSLAETLKATLGESRGRELTDEQSKEIDVAISTSKNSSTNISDLLGLDLPIAENPLLRLELSHFRTREIGRIAGLNGIKIKILQAEKLDPEDLGNAAIDDLVTRKIISAEEGKTLDFLGALSRFSGSNLTLVEALHGHGAQTVRGFISWEQSDWKKFIEDSRIPLPDEEVDVPGYAESLRRVIERSFPSDYFAIRIARSNFDAENALVTELVERKINGIPLIENGSADPSAIDFAGLSDSAANTLKTQVIEFDRFAKTYRHLGIAEIVNDDRHGAAEKSGLVERRLDGLKIFFENNSNIDIYSANFVDEKVEFDWNNIGANERPHVKAQLRAMQRISALTDDATTSLRLLAAGFSSSAEIIAAGETEFLRASGLDHFDGKPLFDRAHERTLSVSHLFEGVREASLGVFDRLRVANTPNLVSTLSKMDGYTELFGSENYCNCDHCRSLLSTSAYFVDLMKFIDSKVSQNIPGSPDDNSRILLENRRPDLWVLDLDCESAATELPYLEIVNEVLTKFLIKSELNDLDDVGDVNSQLASAKNSFSLPVDLNLEELRLYLNELGVHLGDVYETLDQPIEAIHRERLTMSAEELTCISTSDPENAAALFGGLPIDNMDLQDFMKFAGVSREDVTALLSVRALPEIANVSVHTIEDPSDIQLISEQLVGLNVEEVAKERLDIIHRFLRLTRKIGYSIAETDLILVGLKNAELMETLESTANGMPVVLLFAPLFQLRDKLDLSGEEIAAFAGLLPEQALIEGENGLYDRLFDRVGIFGLTGAVDVLGRTVLNDIALLPADPTQDSISGLLAGGLAVSQSDLVALLGLHNLELEIRMSDVTSLYRHARMARGLGISISDLAGLVVLALGPRAMASIEDFVTVCELAAWVEDSPFSVDLLRLIVTGHQSPSTSYNATAETAAAIVQEIQNTILSEEAEETAEEEAVATKKVEYLSVALQVRYNLTADQLETTFLGRLTTVELTTQGIDDALAANFTDILPDAPDDLNILVKLMQELESSTRLFATLRLSVETIGDIVANQTDYGIADLTALTLPNIRTLTTFTKLFKTDRAPEASLQASFRAFPTLPEETVDTLALLLDAPQSLISSVVDILATQPEPPILTAEPMEAISKISAIVAIAKKIGIDGYSLSKLRVSDVREEQAEARSIAFSAAQAKYPEDKVRADRLASMAELTNSRRRDALAALIVANHTDFQFKDREDLYNFFLLDIEMGACFQTSRVICAISSLQSYINRCLLNVEEKVIPKWIPTKEWDWRRNYRVWELNRKFFLYPESFLDPSQRQDKSHLFEALEKELFQQKITKESAEGAYKRYLAGFTELTELRYAGAFNKTRDDHKPVQLGDDHSSGMVAMAFSLPAEIGDEQKLDAGPIAVAGPGNFPSFGIYNSKYYFFARTAKDPFQYYYRTFRPVGNVWGNWIRMDLPIEADRISVAMHHGRICVFWNDVKYKEITKIRGGGATPGSVRFELTTKYSSLNENEEWLPVQKMPLGSLSKGPSEIFIHTIGRGPANDDELERLKEEVYAEFMRKAFGKPYATISGSNVSPIDLSYIWTHDHEAGDVTYQTRHTMVQDGNYNYEIFPTSFVVKNNQFSETATSEATVAVTISDSRTTHKFKAVIKDSSKCVLYHFHSLGFFSPFQLFGPIELDVFVDAIPSNIWTTETGVSLLRNEILDFSSTPIDFRRAPNVSRSYQQILRSGRKYLYPESKLILDKTNTSFYVESNSKNFTDRESIVRQEYSGAATLSFSGASYPVKLDTVLAEEMGEILFNKGLEEFLSLSTQLLTDYYGQDLDFDGPYGQYYWELFFHIPFLIAKHFNANQKFKEAKWWYERIFDPTSPEESDIGLPSDRNWQFREFRNKDADTLKDILTDEAAIAAYKNDPFNPHAIAKLRHSAYQKAAVVEYVDNLIDWANALFARGTRESINEATMLYLFAREVLGARPVQVGECKTKDPLNFSGIEIAMSEGSEFLILLENEAINQVNYLELSVRPVRAGKALEATLRAKNVLPDITRLEDIRRASKTRNVADKIAALKDALTEDEDTEILFANGDVLSAKVAIRTNRLKFDPPYGQPVMRHLAAGNTVVAYRDVALNKVKDVDRIAGAFDVDRDELAQNTPVEPTFLLPAGDVTQQSIAAFCAPPNPYLLALWDRIDVQLTKIRNCQNISGEVRVLALTEPPIDPHMFLRARAAGLSLEDIAGIGPVPEKPLIYRFNSLLPAAKQAAQMVQGFGQSLLSALEKKDAEELRLLQQTHERNIQALTRSVKQRQIKEAGEQLTAAKAGLDRAEINLEHYVGLIESGLNSWETTEQISTHTATGLKIIENQSHLASSLLYLMPQWGSAFALKFGGKELGDSVEAHAAVYSGLGAIASQIAQSAGLEARAQRREQDWKHQRDTARLDVKAQKASHSVAEIRHALAEKDLEVHERFIDQTVEVEEFHKGKYTDLSLYNHLASKLSRLYRDAFTVAQDLARATERAYQFETDDKSSFFIAAGNWDQSHAGLLAGEHLTVQLTAMEANFLSINLRRPEIRQTFSLAMLDGQALIALRQTGSCNFVIPRLAFEVQYPGQYRRLIKAVRISVPSVVGPYANVSAKLTLNDSKVINKLGKEEPVPVVATNSISLSGGMNDSGTFEFAYRDERFLPFEGAGAESSEWTLELPSAVRNFDYDTIADVLVHLDYTALDGDRGEAERGLQDLITEHAADHGLFRLISLREEFPNAWARLTGAVAAAGGAQDVEFSLTDAHFPHLFRNRDLEFAPATKVYLSPKTGEEITPPAGMNMNNIAIDWATGEDIERPGSAGSTDLLRAGTVALNGTVKGDWRFVGAEGALDPTFADDLMILIRYTLPI